MAEKPEARETFEKRVGRKRKKGYYVRSSKRSTGRELSSGMRGVLITSSGGERLCVREAYNLLNEVADNVYGPENGVGPRDSSDQEDNDEQDIEDNGSSSKDIEEQIKKEVEALKGGVDKERRFKSVQSGAKSVVFIKCADEIDPCLLVHRLLCEARDTRVRKARFCSRFIPVEKVCSASLSEIKKHSESVIANHFHGTDPQPVEFAVHFKSRNNNVLKKKDVIDLVAMIVTDNGSHPHVVNLDNPQLVVCVIIIKNMCCMSVVSDFKSLKQYNIQAFYNDPVISSDNLHDNEDKDGSDNGNDLQKSSKPEIKHVGKVPPEEEASSPASSGQ